MPVLLLLLAAAASAPPPSHALRLLGSNEPGSWLLLLLGGAAEEVLEKAFGKALVLPSTSSDETAPERAKPVPGRRRPKSSRIPRE